MTRLLAVLAAACLGCVAPPECWRISSVDVWTNTNHGRTNDGTRAWDHGGGVNLHWDASLCDWIEEKDDEVSVVPGGNKSPVNR